MPFLHQNPIPIKRRLLELAVDWLLISAYLVLLLGLALLGYQIFLGGIPRLSEAASQWLAFLTSVLPVVCLFSLMDYGKGSLGKRCAGLRLIFRRRTLGHAFLRNALKFLPWQLGYIGAIRAVYRDGDALSLVLCLLAILVILLYLGTGLLRQDKRHPADWLAGSQVQD